MSKKFGAWILAAAFTFTSAATFADVAGAPAGGGGSTGTSTSTGGSGGKSGGGCSTVSPGGATTTGLILVAVGLLGVAPALRRSRQTKPGRKSEQG